MAYTMVKAPATRKQCIAEMQYIISVLKLNPLTVSREELSRFADSLVFVVLFLERGDNEPSAIPKAPRS